MRQLLWVWMLLMALAFVNDRCHCCLQEERSGLLEIKAWFTHVGAGFSELEDWDKEDLNCCNWGYRVACDNTTNRVIELDLPGVNHGALEKDLYLNASLFLPFKELETLYLSDNQLVGGLKNQGFQGLASGLRKLKDLRLSNNKFNDSILSSLSGFSTLKSLHLSNNSFTGTIGLHGLRKLEVLYLESSDFKENILLESLGGLPSLKTLYARGSTFKGKHFGKGLCNSTGLEEMYLEGSSLPSSFLGNIGTTLKFLDLSEVDFHDTLPTQAPLNLTKLEELNLDYASPITTSFLRIIGSLPALRTLNLEGCMINGTLPHQGNMSYLAYLDLSNNHMSCELLEHNLPIVGSSLRYLELSSNNFKGLLPPSMFNMTELVYLFLDGNEFVGEVPGTISSLLSIDISNNLLSGMLPRGIGNSSIYQMEEIDLSRNHFEGTIPTEYFNSYGIEFLDLSENNLSGSLPLGFEAPSLRYVNLYRNQLSGQLPYAFRNLSSLVALDLGDNNLTGPIPDWIDSVSELSIFALKSNQFNGELPYQLCLLRRLSILDLSENNFSGHLPSCLSNLNVTASDEKSGYSYHTTPNIYDRDLIIDPNMDIFDATKPVYYPDDWYDKMKEINVKIAIELTSKKHFYTYAGDILRYMSVMDLSCNTFTGEIPIEWGNLSGIHTLNLSQNNLTGLIPSSFSNLKKIESLDLSHNNLNGRIPAQLIELTFLAVFNVSYNNLSGKTPEWKYQFATYDESSYKGNPLLCGPPLGNSCDKTIESPSEIVPGNSNGDDGSIDMDIFYVSFGVCYVIVVLTILVVLCINPNWRRRWFYFIEECIDTCYCVLTINFRKFFRSRR